jgi:hypothetical protein
MPRPLQSRAALPLAALGLALLALAPRPAIDWARWLRNPYEFIFGPVRQPTTWVISRLHPAPVEGDVDPRKLTALKDQYHLSYLQARAEVDSLREVIRAISETQKLNTSRVRLTLSAVIGTGPDLSGGMYTIQAGTRENIRPGDVVVAQGINILGRVRRVDQLTSVVLPIFAATAPKLAGVVMLTDDTIGPCCQLSPGPGGRLVGRLCPTADPTGAGPGVQVAEGMTVRLNDPDWPQSSRMLVIGRIERIETRAANWQWITVLPLAGVSGAGEVMVRSDDYGPDAAASTPPAPAPQPTTQPTKPAPRPAPAPGGRR